MRVLAGGVEGVAVLGLVIDRDGRARLHGVGRKPVVDHAHFGDMRRARDGGVGGGFVSKTPIEDQVAGRVVVDLRRTGFKRPIGLRHGG